MVRPYKARVRTLGVIGNIVGSRRGIATLTVVAIATALFYLLDWLPLRHLLATSLRTTLSGCGFQVLESGLSLHVSGLRFNITRECTYINWVICATPFLWRNVSLSRNLATSVIAAVVVWGLNIVRVTAAIVANVAGISWFWAHDFVDYFTWYGTFVVVVVLWIRWMGFYLELWEKRDDA